MNETHVTVVGNALHTPQWRRTANTGAVVTTFKIASTARRFERETGRWIDGNSLRVRVTCWRTLAENVKNSVTSGDPLIVTGRLFTRDWEDESGAKRIAYELEASSVGHDLSRGRAVFERVKSNTSTSVIDDAEAEQRIGGESTEPVPDSEAPTQFNDMSFEDALEGGLAPATEPTAPPAAVGPTSSTGPTSRTGPIGPVAPTEPAVPPEPAGMDGLPLADDEVIADEFAPVAVAEPAVAQAGESEAGESGPGALSSRGQVDEPSSGRRRGLRRARVSA